MSSLWNIFTQRRLTTLTVRTKMIVWAAQWKSEWDWEREKKWTRQNEVQWKRFHLKIDEVQRGRGLKGLCLQWL